MNHQFLSHFSSTRLELFFGIESTDLLDELTDHYSGLIEERVEKRASLDEAFQTFVAQIEEASACPLEVFGEVSTQVHLAISSAI